MQYQYNVSEIKQVVKCEHELNNDMFLFAYLPYTVKLNTGNCILSEFEISLN